MKEIVKNNLGTFAQGIMFGFGFCIAAWALYFVFQSKSSSPQTARCEASATTATTISSQAKNDKFSFSNVEEVKRNGRSYFVGVIKNNSSSPARSISIGVDLFNKGKFVDQCSSYVAGDVGPNEERYFKVSCGCKDEPPAEHDTFKIGVIGDF